MTITALIVLAIILILLLAIAILAAIAAVLYGFVIYIFIPATQVPPPAWYATAPDALIRGGIANVLIISLTLWLYRDDLTDDEDIIAAIFIAIGSPFGAALVLHYLIRGMGWLLTGAQVWVAFQPVWLVLLLTESTGAVVLSVARLGFNGERLASAFLSWFPRMTARPWPAREFTGFAETTRHTVHRRRIAKLRRLRDYLLSGVLVQILIAMAIDTRKGEIFFRWLKDVLTRATGWMR